MGATTFGALTANSVYTDLWTHVEGKDPQHIRLAQQADLILVAPCTANMLGKMAHGLAGDLVSTILIAADPTRCWWVRVAMNEGMWNHPATQRNAKRVFGRWRAVCRAGERVAGLPDGGGWADERAGGDFGGD